jgi:penicillin-binding protein 1A
MLIRRAILFLKMLSGCLLLLFCFLLGVMVYFFHQEPIDLTVLERYAPAKPTILLDDQGQEWARFEFDARQYKTLKEFPQILIDAFLCSEDREFYQHHGLSVKGILRSTIKNTLAGKIVQGASTITQQLVKLLYFDCQKTYKRKLKELIVSLLIEHYYTKQQILEIYLNHVYFSYGIYGVEAAAQRFWHKSISELTVAQCATLASIIQCPGLYSPLIYPERTLVRRNIILQSMWRLGLIDNEEYQTARQEKLECLAQDTHCIAPHAKEAIRQFLEKKFGRDAVYKTGLIVRTTLNFQLQEKANQAFKNQITKLKDSLKKDIDGGLVIIQKDTGDIKALVGGFDFAASKFNRVTQARRQLGSIFKPLIYAKVIEKGYSLTDLVDDLPLEIATNGPKNWCPQNFNKKFAGPMTMAKGLSYSNNIVSIKALNLAGIEEVCQVAKNLNFVPPGKFQSLALGCLDGTLIDVVGAFNVFTNHGEYVTPNLIKWVKSHRGVKIFNAEVKRKKIFDSQVSDQVVSVLSIGMERFKARNAAKLQTQAFGKTGTTNDNRINWFCGATSNLTTALCLACDDNQPLGFNVYPVTTAFPIWLAIHQDFKHPDFYFHPALKTVKINWQNGALVNNLAPSSLDLVELHVNEVRAGRYVEPLIPEAVLKDNHQAELDYFQQLT